MRPTGRARLAAVAAAACAGACFAQELTVGGSNTVRWERYGTSGDRTFTPYAQDLATGFDALSLELGWTPRAGSFDKWKANIDAVLNDSPYRSSDRGFVPERLAVVRENGEAAIPYRAEAGEFYGFTTNRTQQRSLKGAALDLQPGTSGTQSILVFAGAAQPTWRHFRWRDDNSVGLSWLAFFKPQDATLNVSALRNERSPEADGIADRRTQRVVSLAGYGGFAWSKVPWLAGWHWDAEIATMRGDHEDLGDGSGGRDKRDNGYFVQLAKNQAAGEFDWRVRGERYGKDFRPFGASVTPDRRSGEAYLGWTSLQGLRVEARGQSYRDGYQSPNPLDTRTVGLSANGQLSTGVQLNADVFRQTLERADASVDQKTVSVRAQVSFRLASWDAQAGVFMQKQDDALLPQSSPRTHELSFNISRPFLILAGWKATLSPGVVWRNVTNTPSSHRDLEGTLALELKRDEIQKLRVVANRRAQDAVATATPDVATIDLGIEYRHRFGRHEIGLDYVAFERRPQPGENTRAYRAGVQWTFYFDKPPPMYSVAAAPLALAAPSAAFERDLSIVAALPLGTSLDIALARVGEAGFGAGARQASAVVYEARLIPDADGRQRLAIAHDAGRVERVALIVSLNAADAARTYDAVMRAMIARFGRPAGTFEEGSFGPALANDVAMGRFTRVAEWRVVDGVLRVGIPRRLDGVARIEIQHARSLGSLRDTGWSLDAVR